MRLSKHLNLYHQEGSLSVNKDSRRLYGLKSHLAHSIYTLIIRQLFTTLGIQSPKLSELGNKKFFATYFIHLSCQSKRLSLFKNTRMYPSTRPLRCLLSVPHTQLSQNNLQRRTSEQFANVAIPENGTPTLYLCNPNYTCLQSGGINDNPIGDQ